MFRHVLVQEKDAAGIPCLHLLPEGLASPPTIILYHGWSSSKENQRFLGSILAAQGFGVIAPDAPGHGSRGGIDFSDPKAVIRNFWETVLAGVDESESLLNAIFSWQNVNPTRLGVMGISMGSFMGSGVFCNHHQLQTFISLIGCGSWTRAANNWDAQNVYPTADQMIKIQKGDPSSRAKDMGDRPVLLLHGDADPVVDVALEKDFHETLSAAYPDSKRIHLQITPGLGHFLELDMIEAACIWLQETL